MRTIDPTGLKVHVETMAHHGILDGRIPPVVVSAAIRHLDGTRYRDEPKVVFPGRTDGLTMDDGTFRDRMAAARRAFVEGGDVTDPMGCPSFVVLVDKAIALFSMTGRVAGVDHAPDLERIRSTVARFRTIGAPPADLEELAALHDEARIVLAAASPALQPGSERLTVPSGGRLHGVPLTYGDLAADLKALGARLDAWSDVDDPNIHFVSIRDDATGLPTAVVVMDRIWIADVVTAARWVPERRRRTGTQMHDIVPYLGILPERVRAIVDVVRARKGGAILAGLPSRTLEDGIHRGDGVTFTILNGRLHSVDDRPAVSYDNGRMEWRKDGVLHRRHSPALFRGEDETVVLDRFPYVDSPLDLDRAFVPRLPIADVWSTFKAENYHEGRLHSAEGPAAYGGPDGLSVHLLNGRLHRDGDRPAIHDDRGLEIHADGGTFHRDMGFAISIPGDMQATALDGRYVPVGDGPSVVSSDGRRSWLSQGMPYRTDGPSIVHPDGTEEWWSGKGYELETRRPGGEMESEMTTPERELLVKDLQTMEIVHRVDVSGKSDREVEKVEMGMSRRIDIDKFCVVDSKFDEEPDAPEADQVDGPSRSTAPRP